MSSAAQPGVAEGFGAVADAFRRSCADPGQEAAALAVVHRGRRVVDLWAGTDVVNQRPMPADGLMMVASCSKGITATVLAVLVERGVLDPGSESRPTGRSSPPAARRVSRWRWSRRTPPGCRTRRLGTGLSGLDLQRGEAVTQALAAARPLWEPGTAMAYHPVTYGTLLDEIVRRVTGTSIAHHVRTLIAEPLGVDMWMGLPETLTSRVVPDRWEQSGPGAAEDDEVPPPGSYAALRKAFLRENAPMDPDYSDPVEVRAHYAAERPAVGAVTDARALATMYAALLGPVDGVRLVEDRTRRQVTRPRTDDVETLVESGTAGPDIRFGLGYQLASPSMPGFGPDSFGHTGAGGRLGIGDPEHEIGFGYVTSLKREIGPHGDPRWRTLIDAVRACL